MKRKRGTRGSGGRKRLQTASHHLDEGLDYNPHPILQHYYPSCLTLHAYLEEALCNASRVGEPRDPSYVNSCLSKIVDQDVQCILKQIIVARTEREPSRDHVEFKRDLAVFTQQLPSSSIGQQTSDGERQQIEVSLVLDMNHGVSNNILTVHDIESTLLTQSRL